MQSLITRQAVELVTPLLCAGQSTVGVACLGDYFGSGVLETTHF